MLSWDGCKILLVRTDFVWVRTMCLGNQAADARTNQRNCVSYMWTKRAVMWLGTRVVLPTSAL